eukprot:3080922-Rhodomonas_salina.2
MDDDGDVGSRLMLAPLAGLVWIDGNFCRAKPPRDGGCFVTRQTFSGAGADRNTCDLASS